MKKGVEEEHNLLRRTLSLPDLPPMKPPPPPVAFGAAAPIAVLCAGLCGVYKLSVRFGSRGDGIISWPSVRCLSSTSSNG